MAAVKFSSVKFEANINQVGGAETAVKTLLVPVAATARHILHNIFIKSSSLTSHPLLRLPFPEINDKVGLGHI